MFSGNVSLCDYIMNLDNSFIEVKKDVLKGHHSVSNFIIRNIV